MRTIHRDGELTILPAGDQSDLLRVSVSSSRPVRSWGRDEVLVHTSEAINLERAAVNGLPLTVNHSEVRGAGAALESLPVGRARNPVLDGDRLRFDLDFDVDPVSEAVRGKVLRGVLPDVSITASVEEETTGSDGVVMMTRWTPLAVSLVPVPADPGVGVGRGLAGDGGPVRFGDTNNRGGETTMNADDPMAAALARHDAIRADAATFARLAPGLADRLRAMESAALAAPEVTADAFRTRALALMGEAEPLAGEPAPGPAPVPVVPGAVRQALVVPGADHREKVARGFELALSERVRLPVEAREMEGNQLRGWDLADCVRELLIAHGTDPRGMSREQLFRAAISMRAISPGTPQYETSDFPAVTENVLTKLVHRGFAEEERVWDRVCSDNEVPDLKPFTIPRISSISNLPVVAEKGTYQPLTQVDAKETATPVKRGGLISWTLESMINDDMGMLRDTSVKLGQSAQRTLDQGFIDLLLANPTMSDGNPLFDSVSRTLPTQGTNALDLDGIVDTRSTMAEQKDDNGTLLNVLMRILLVPERLRDTADNLAGSEYLPWPESAPGAQRVNTVRSTFTVAATARLTDATDWYAFARPGDTIECAFLRGMRQPSIEREQGWDIDAIHYKARHFWVFYARDWRGCFKNVVAG